MEPFTGNKPKVGICDAGVGDADEIAAIELQAHNPPWTRESIADELRKDSVINLVARMEGHSRIIGYIFCWIIVDELHIHRLTTHHDFRRKGVATRLIGEAMDRAQRGEIQSVFLDVRATNFPALQLYEKLGFSRLALRKKYYEPDGDDAWVMRREIGKPINNIPRT
jgi:ribosomal-protein-alanine N-acetyltransferase